MTTSLSNTHIINIASKALIKIGAEPISSFSDGTSESLVIANLYDNCRDYVLSSYPWSFATTQQRLVRSNEKPIADYSYVFYLPPDFLRMLSIGNANARRSKGLDYKIINNKIHCQESAIIVNYIYRADEASFPAFFTSLLISALAAEICIPITENTSRADLFQRIFKEDMLRAKSLDAQQQPPNAIEDFALIDVRS